MDSSPVLPDYRCYVGVDIAATSFTALWTTDGRPLPRAVTFSQNPSGFAAFQGQLQATGVAPAQTLIVLEATGSYWIALAVTLHDAGYAVAVLNPAHLHSYLQSLPRRAKTDALDAQVFLRFASERRPHPWTPPPAVYHELRQRLVARDGLLSIANRRAINAMPSRTGQSWLRRCSRTLMASSLTLMSVSRVWSRRLPRC